MSLLFLIHAWLALALRTCSRPCSTLDHPPEDRCFISLRLVLITLFSNIPCSFFSHCPCPNPPHPHLLARAFIILWHIMSYTIMTQILYLSPAARIPALHWQVLQIFYWHFSLEQCLAQKTKNYFINGYRKTEDPIAQSRFLLLLINVEYISKWSQFHSNF